MWIVYSLLFLLAYSGVALGQVPQREGGLKHIGVAVEFTKESEADVVQWSRVESYPGSSFLRLHFSDILDRSTERYSIVLSDRSGRIIQELKKEEFGRRRSLWTKVIFDDFVRVEVIAHRRPAGLQFKLLEMAHQQRSFVPFSITVPDEREAIIAVRDLPRLFVRSRAVAKLSFISNGAASMCTGFLIDNDRMLTNEHCIGTALVCDAAIAIFGYAVNEAGRLNLGEQYRCVELLSVNKDLDFALIRLEGMPGAIWGRLELTRRLIVQDEQTFIIGHPAGEPMQVSRKGCSVTTPVAEGLGVDTDFGHKCDTLGGNSGSPVLGHDYKVIGLHHLGFSGEGRWSDENRAVRLMRIMDELRLP